MGDGRRQPAVKLPPPEERAGPAAAGDHLSDAQLAAELATAQRIAEAGRQLLAEHGTGSLVRAMRHAYGFLASALPAGHEVPVPPDDSRDGT